MLTANKQPCFTFDRKQVASTWPPIAARRAYFKEFNYVWKLTKIKTSQNDDNPAGILDFFTKMYFSLFKDLL